MSNIITIFFRASCYGRKGGQVRQWLYRVARGGEISKKKKTSAVKHKPVRIGGTGRPNKTEACITYVKYHYDIFRSSPNGRK